MINWIENHQHLAEVQETYNDLLVLLFHGNFSPASKRALAELEQFSSEDGDVPVYALDVEKVKGVHKQFDVKTVPTVVALKHGAATHRLEGVESAQFYARLFSGSRASSSKTTKAGAPAHRVVASRGRLYRSRLLLLWGCQGIPAAPGHWFSGDRRGSRPAGSPERGQTERSDGCAPDRYRRASHRGF